MAGQVDSVRAAARVPRAAAQRVPPRVRCALATLQTPGMEHEACAARVLAAEQRMYTLCEEKQWGNDRQTTSPSIMPTPQYVHWQQ